MVRKIINGYVAGEVIFLTGVCVYTILFNGLLLTENASVSAVEEIFD
jgi:hypothetical protein